MATRPELHEVLAQSSSPPAAHPQEVTSPAQNAGAQVDPAEPAAQQNAHALPPAGPPRRQLADYSANLLKLANRVKAEVDSTTADTLSIAAIRDVQEIEKLAHKMRTQ
jgi:type VI protein secretion system component VasF